MHVELKEIRKYFGEVKANDNISVSLEPGKIYGLLGENGAGKSTLMKILSGYQPQDSGEILLDHKAVDFPSPAAALGAGLGMLYQDPLDIPPFSIIDNYLLGRDNRLSLDYRTVIAEMNEIITRYGFEADIHAHIDTLSLGERQQLELVRLLAGGAQVFILDEPTTGISVEQKDVLFSSMRKLAHEEGKTIILVSHKLDEVQELCDHAFVLRRGKLVGQSTIPCPNEKLVEMMFGQVPTRRERLPFDLGNPALELINVNISTYRLNVSNINLQIFAGEVIGLAGLEGSGQGILLRTIAGLIQPESGQVVVSGQDLTKSSYHKSRNFGVAYCAAGRLEEGLVSKLSLTEHMLLAEPTHTFMIDWPAARERTNSRIEQYQVVGQPESTADQLSGGNQQRLLFALLNPGLKVILLEHPTRGLDVRSMDWIWEQMYARREDGTALVFMSADLDEILERSDRIAVFSGGVMSRVVNASEVSVDQLGHMIGGQA
ncbi:MAG: ATP-binding cassette domain-containing protein [Chloroflexi bacterium]|nr:ATP-binding cassette domain-containing protein [Chloroflexota bacterium]